MKNRLFKNKSTKIMKNRLFKNESIKIWSQTSNRVIVIILAVIIVMIPILTYVANRLLSFGSGYYYGAEQQYEHYLEVAQSYREYEGASGIDLAEAYYYETEASVIKFFIDRELIGSWKYDTYYNRYRDAKLRAEAVRLLAEEGFDIDVIDQSSFKYYFMYMGSEEDYLFDLKTGKYMRIEEDGSLTPVDITHKDYYDYIKGHVSSLEAEIINTDFSGRLAAYAAGLRVEYAEAEAMLKDYELQLKIEPDSDELKYGYATAELRVECLAEKVRLADYLVAANVDQKDWRYRTVTILANSVLEERMGLVIRPKSLHAENWGSYDDYVAETEAKIKASDDALAILNYSLDNEIPTPYSLEKSAKLSWQSAIISSIGYIRIFMIILAGTIVSGEFSSGSIRLLLIRPKKRWKILTSKLTAAAFWSFALMLVSVFLLFVINIIINGVTDILTPDLVLVGDSVVRLPAMLTALRVLVLAALPAFLVFAFAFLFSVLTRKSALSIALSLILNTLFGIASAISVMLLQSGEVRQYVGFLEYTPLPYNDLNSLIINPLSYYGGSFSGLIMSGTSYLYGAGAKLSVVVGSVVLIVFTALLIALSYLSFNKRQIKS